MVKGQTHTHTHTHTHARARALVSNFNGLNRMWLMISATVGYLLDSHFTAFSNTINCNV